jgi:ATP phosphoribosyltransferase regulatory subunit HisZ
VRDDSDEKSFTEQQRGGLDARRADHDRTLEAMHRLEAALADAAPGREERWRNEVLQALSVLDAAAAEEADNARRPDSFLSDLAHNQPRLRNRARALRLQYEKVRDTIASLRHELEGREDVGLDFADLRQRIGWVLTSLRHQRARESDLIYEAYYDAFNVELRTPGGQGRP